MLTTIGFTTSVTLSSHVISREKSRVFAFQALVKKYTLEVELSSHCLVTVLVSF